MAEHHHWAQRVGPESALTLNTRLSLTLTLDADTSCCRCRLTWVPATESCRTCPAQCLAPGAHAEKGLYDEQLGVERRGFGLSGFTSGRLGWKEGRGNAVAFPPYQCREVLGVVYAGSLSIQVMGLMQLFWDLPKFSIDP